MHLCEHPTYKTKKSQHRKSHYSYRLRNDRFYIDGSNIRIPGFKRGKMISCKYNTGLYKKDNIVYHQVDLIRDNLGNYSVGFYTIENKPLEYINSIPESKAIGIDINIRKDRRYVCSDGTIFKGRDLSSKIKNIDNLNSRIDKMEKANPNIKPSKRLEKLILRRRKVYNKIHNINEYEVQYYSKQVINKHPKTVVMEDISIREITSKNKFIAKAAHFINLYRFTEVMRYKCNQYNIPFIQADRNFKSSQICSCCGSIQPMPMHKKVYNCPICNLKIDRDLNAAINLSKLA